MDSGCGLTNARGRSQPEHRTQQDAPNHAQNCSADWLPSITGEIRPHVEIAGHSRVSGLGSGH
jgi:hypothetical protein